MAPGCTGGKAPRTVGAATDAVAAVSSQELVNGGQDLLAVQNASNPLLNDVQKLSDRRARRLSHNGEFR